MKNGIKSNNGYTLIEMIIVIAIIAVMSGVGFLTISSIRASQATASLQKFDSELSALEMRTRTQKSGEAVRIVQNGANYDIFYGEYRFCKYNSNNTVGRVNLNQYTGGHTYGKN